MRRKEEGIAGEDTKPSIGEDEEGNSWDAAVCLLGFELRSTEVKYIYIYLSRRNSIVDIATDMLRLKN